MEQCFIGSKLALLCFIQVFFSTFAAAANHLSTAKIDIGCLDASQVSGFKFSPGNYDQDQFIPHTCAILCASIDTKMAGATGSDICVCGDKVIDTSNNGICDEKCSGDSGVLCGGQTTFNVYNVTSLLRNSPQITFSIKPVLFETASFVGTVNGTESPYYLAYEYTDLLNTNDALLFGNTYNYTFTAWGDNVQMSVIVLDPLMQEFKLTFSVSAPLKVSSLKCPSYALVSEDFECSGRLDLGKDVNVTWEYDGMSKTMPLADPVSLHVGSPVHQWIDNFGVKTATNGLVICLTCKVTQPVIIHAWEMNVNRSGTVNITILRPSCPDGLVFCPITDACCSLDSEFSSELCSQENSFCGSASICNYSTTMCGSNKTTIPIPLKNSYNVVYNDMFNVQKGYNLKLLPSYDVFEYLPGDLLCWVKTSNGATINIDPNSGRYSVLTNFPAAPQNSTITLTTQQQNDAQVGTSLLAGIASRSVNVILNTTSVSSKGNRSVTFTYKTNSGQKWMKTHSVFSLNPIGNISLSSVKNANSCAIYAPLNETFNISLHISAGTMAQVIWKVENITIKAYPHSEFGDREEIDVQQHFTLSSIDEYFLSVMVSNPLSGQLIHSRIIIQEKITGLSVELIPNNVPTFQGIRRRLNASVTTGNSVTYKWHFGDGSEVEVSIQDTIEHIYLTEGQVNTTIEASNMVSSMNVSIVLNVSNPVQMSLPPYGVNGSSTNLTCRLPDSYTDEYMTVFEIDNSSLVTTNCSTVQYVFSSGLHHISCGVRLGPVVVVQNDTLFVLERISRLKILPLPPIEVGATRLVETNITTGNNVSYLWNALGQSYATHLTSAMSLTFSTFGKIKVSVNASNAISEDYAELFVIVQEAVGNLTVNTLSNPGQSNLTISFNITKTSGTEVYYTVNISDRSYFQALSPSSHFTYSFVEGLHDILVRGSNNISQSSSTYRMIIQDPLVYPVVITCPWPGVWYQNGVYSVCVLERNKNFRFSARVKYATNVSFTWSWEYPGNQTKSDKSPSVVNQLVESTAYNSFTESKTYNVFVFAENNVSNVEKWISVFPLDLVNGFSFSAPPAVPINEIFWLNVSLSKGSNVTFSFDAGDKSIADALLETRWSYPKIGIFLINGYASNLLSNATYSHSVAVQEKVISVRFLELVSFANVSAPVNVKWQVQGGTNVSTLITWDDGTQHNVSYTGCTKPDSKKFMNCTTSHPFLKAKSYQINLTAHNLVSWSKSVSRNVVIEYPIKGLKITTNVTKAYIYTDPVLITVTITEGTSVKYVIDIGNGEKVDIGTKLSTYIKYQKSREYTPNVVASNHIDQKTATATDHIEIIVRPYPVKIEGLTLRAEHTVFGNSTSLQVSYKAGAEFECDVNFGAGPKKTFTEEQVNEPIIHKYSEPKDYEVTITCYNSLNSLDAPTVTVHVHEKIQQFRLNNGTIKTGYPSEFNIHYSWKDGSHVKVVAFAKIGKNKEMIKKEEGYENMSPTQRKTGFISFSSADFASPGYYTIYFNASNAISNAQSNITLHLIQRIAGLELLVNPFVSTNYSLVAYLVYKKGSELNVRWNFGDETGEQTSNCTWSQTCSREYTYSKVGNYSITATASNSVTPPQHADTSVVIENPILGWTFSSVNVSQLNSPSFIELKHDRKFPFPTDAKYKIKYGDGKKLNETDLSVGSSYIKKHMYTLAKCYQATVTIENKVSTVVLTTKIKVRGGIKVPDLYSKTVQGGNPNMTAILPIEYPVNLSSNIVNSCLNYNWTIRDGSHILHINSSIYFLYTFRTTGIYNVSLTVYDDDISRFVTEYVQVEKSVTALFLSSDGVAKINETVTFVLLCASVGTSTYFEVTYEKDSTREQLPPVKNITEDFRNKNAKLDVPFNPVGFYGVIFNHTYTRNDTFVVTVYTRNSTTNDILTNKVVIENLPCPLPKVKIIGGSPNFKTAPDVPYEVHYTFFSETKTNCEDNIDIEFEWSVYKADVYLMETLGASIPPQENMIYDLNSNQKDKTHIRTNQSSLSIPRKTILPGLYIFQLSVSLPDLEASAKYYAYLKIQRPPLIVLIKGGSARSVPWNERFILDARSTIDPLWPLTDHLKYEWSCKQKETPDGKGGCFGGGILLYKYSDENKAEFRAKLLVEKFTYQFTVKVSTDKGGSTVGHYTQEIRGIPGHPPVLGLRCISNCSPLLNPDARLSLEGECKASCVNAKYQWRLQSSTSSDTTASIWPNKTLTPIDSSTLVVKARTFKENRTYVLRMEVTNKDGKTGFASYEVNVNSPPHGGKCEFLPKQGIAMKTPFNFTCRNWIDDQKNTRQPLIYKVFYTSPVDSNYKFLVHHGPKTTLNNIYLPSGHEEKNYTYQISMRVEDVYGAFGKVEFSVKVEPETISSENEIEALNNRTLEYHKLVGSGDIQAANRFAISIMTQMKSNDKNASRKNEIFKDIVKRVSANLPGDLDSMRQSLDTVVVAVDTDDEILAETQVAAMDTILRTSRKLRSESQLDIGNDKVEDIAIGLLTGIGNIMKSSSLTQNRIDDKKKGNITATDEDKQDLNNKGAGQTGGTETKISLKEAFSSTDDVTASILEKKVKDEERVIIKTKNMQANIKRANSDGMNGTAVEFLNNSAKIGFPENFKPKSFQTDLSIVDVVGLYMSSNPFISSDSDDNKTHNVDSSSVSLELKHKNGSAIKVEELDEPLEIEIPRADIHDNEQVSENKTETKLSGLTVHILKLNVPNNAFVIEITPEKQDVNISLYFRNSSAPTLTTFDSNKTFAPTESPGNYSATPLRYFLENSFITGKLYYVGVGSRWNNGTAVVMNYTFRSYEIGCYYWDDVLEAWTTKGCTPAESTETLVRCRCYHATLFGSNFIVAPNKLDISKEILNLANLGDYPALIVTICVILGLYIIAMVWAKRKDRREAGKVTLHVAVDNEPGDRQRYEVVMCTGSRRSAGSTAEVSLIIYGDQGDGDPSLLQRTSSISFQRSSQDSYLVTTPQSLGSLMYIRVWHDNAGSDPSWFLSEVIIRDVETGEKYFFLCNSWLACDEGDGLVERLIPAASAEELKDFQYLFTQNSSQGFSDGHLWFSIILRPAQSRFTHAQRISCCLCLLLCTMLTNAMFFGVEVKKENNVDVDVGPYQFTWHEVMVGIQSSLIVFPINLFIVSIFRRIAARPRKSSKYLTGGPNSLGKTSKVGISLRDIELEKNRRKVQEINERGDYGQEEHPETTSPGTKKTWLFPWWFIYVAWIILICVSIIAGFFTLLYGISFGKQKQEKWLTALVISVFQDILISQPIKIFALSLFVAFVIRKPNTGEVHEENDELLKDEEWIQESLFQANPDGIARKKDERKPPDELILRKMRVFRQNERKMFHVFREVIRYFFFWWIVLMIAYGYREPDAHLLTTSMEATFAQLGRENDNFFFKRDSTNDIYKTRNRRDLLMWLRDVVIPGLNYETWYNNKTVTKNNLISDGTGYLVGHSRLRLLRVRKDTCKLNDKVKKIMDGCESEYSYSDEYQVKHNRKDWIAANQSMGESDENEKWQYKTQSELYERPFFGNLATYRGGGYVLELKRGEAEAQQQINELNESSIWIDGQTRAVFVEFTVFSPNKNLHCIVTLYFECPASGGCTAKYQILATRLDELIGNYRLFVLVCELIFIFFLASFTYKMSKQLIKEGKSFWKMFWNWIEMGIIATGWSCLAFYIIRFIANKWTKSKFHEDGGSFVSFRYVATADQLYGIILAFVVFLSSIKFLRLFRFNRRMSLLGSTLKYASWDLCNFLFLFGIAFVAFSSVAYLLFQNNIDMFSSMLVTTQTLLNIILGKFKYMNLSHDTFVASAVVLVLYVVVVVFILINVFMVILNDAFQVVKHDNDMQENEYEIVDYITGRFKSWIGIKSAPSKLKSDFEHEFGFRPTYVSTAKRKNEVPATVVLDRKVQQLVDFVDKQEECGEMEDLRLKECKDQKSLQAALLLLMNC